MAYISELSVLLIPDIGIDIGMDTSIGISFVISTRIGINHQPGIGSVWQSAI